MATVYNIPEGNWEMLCKRLEKLTRRAKKLGRLTPTLTKVGEHKVKQGDFYQNVFEVTIQSEQIAISGWELVAAIDVVEDDEVGRVIRRVPGVLEGVDLPANYRHATDYCEHCEVNRRRNTVFILRNRDSGEWKQVGRNCLGPFLGGIDPETVVQYAETLISLDGLCSGAQDSGFFGMSGKFDYLDLTSTLVFTSFAISKLGWMSRSKASEYGKTATADIIADAYFTVNNYKSEAAKQLLQDYQDCQDRARYEHDAEASIDWIRNLPESERNDYLHNLSVVAAHETFNRKHLALACSLLVAHSNSVRVQSERLEKPKSIHVGDVGKRETFNLEVTDVKYWQSAYGTTTAVFFKDIFDNILVWKASKDPNLEVGSKYELSAKVKAHTTYRDRAQTEISHAKILVSA